jgi:hexosaminidase
VRDATRKIPLGWDVEHEGYSLTVEKSSNANEGILCRINASYWPGAVRGIDSLFQLFETYDEGSESEYMVRYSPISIRDRPGLPYRGVMIDTSRQFYSVQTLKDIILSEALGKINVFHWHLNDDDSFPFESRDYPDLTDYTAFSPLEVYSI